MPQPEPEFRLGRVPEAPPAWAPPTVNGVLSALVFALPAPLFLLAPVPLFLAHRRQGSGGAAWAAFAGLLTSALLAFGMAEIAQAAAVGGPSLAQGLGGYIAGALAPALVLAWAAKSGPDGVSGVTRATGAYLLGLFGVWMVVEAVVPGGAYGLVYRWVGESIASVIQVAEEAGRQTPAARQALADLVGRKAWYQKWTAALLPALCVIGVIVGMWLNMLYARWLSKGDGEDGGFCAFQMPFEVIYGFMVCVALVLSQIEPLVGFFPDLPSLLIAALNGLLVLSALYWLQGIAVTNHYFFRLRLSPGMRILGIGLQALLISRPLTSVAFAATGLADAWFDLRRLEADRENDGEER